MQYADRALMEGLKGRCAMLLHPHVTQDSALPLLQQALAMDSDRSPLSNLRCSSCSFLIITMCGDDRHAFVTQRKLASLRSQQQQQHLTDLPGSMLGPYQVCSNLVRSANMH